MSHAVVLGEALIDLLDGDCAGERVYRQAIGGAPLNVAVGVARLGGAVEFAGSVGDDVLGDRLAGFLANAGVGTRNLLRVPAPTTLAVATFDGAEPDFRFYGEPPSYGAFGPADLDQTAVQLRRGALLRLHRAALSPAAGRRPPGLGHQRPTAQRPGTSAAAPCASLTPTCAPACCRTTTRWWRCGRWWSSSPPLPTWSSSAPPTHRCSTTAPPPRDAARRLRAVGAGTVVVTLGARGALVVTGGEGVGGEGVGGEGVGGESRYRRRRCVRSTPPAPATR